MEGAVIGGAVVLDQNQLRVGSWEQNRFFLQLTELLIAKVGVSERFELHQAVKEQAGVLPRFC
ncbi:hypothetical protein A2911_00445 [Candidatus Nomurabacteria bacterium RIFCSPLOWO2_01_FULL_40_15]|uniref:Uncharacterized protein n=1 Tax=Candidatus Nomurabacteria bacterium RIFCSPLOWO2_01_FULL_40_15 TaxID=1801772 RepID=A0A1F6X7H5_9BACT|nr:MAG: hypothetical protein A2911_00445 [Candidatus Nomurabacteria bacterium RIFCSPLOWO2_01_FULL_40_15]